MEGTSSSRLNRGGIAVLVVVGLGALAVWLIWTGTVAGGKPLCEVCKRTLRPELSFEFATANGSVKRTCCPRCGLVAMIQKGGSARWAVDFVSRKRVRAADAIYLEGSDIMECCSDAGFRTNEGTYRDMEYDRCLPSLLSFARRTEAEKVQREHGGTIINFAQARESVARQLSTH